MLHYLLEKKTVAVHDGPDGSPAIFIPSGTAIMVPDDFANATGCVEVEWVGKIVQMFAVDLCRNGKLFKPQVRTPRKTRKGVGAQA